MIKWYHPQEDYDTIPNGYYLMFRTDDILEDGPYQIILIKDRFWNDHIEDYNFDIEQFDLEVRLFGPIPKLESK